MITVEYRFEGKKMTHDEWENQEEKEFIITKKMIIYLLEKHTSIPKGLHVDYNNIYINKE